MVVDKLKEPVDEEFFELRVPTRMMEPLFSTFSTDEKGLAIATVLQQRLDKAIEAFDTEGDGADDSQPEETAEK